MDRLARPFIIKAQAKKPVVSKLPLSRIKSAYRSELGPSKRGTKLSTERKLEENKV